MGACTLGALTVFIFSFFAQDRTGRAERLRLGVIAFAAAVVYVVQLTVGIFGSAVMIRIMIKIFPTSFLL